MGKSAKLHKRLPKKLKSSVQTSRSASSSVQTQVSNAQKKAARKNKAVNAKGGKHEGPVLGDADYVTLMMGGRRKARVEAAKLPQDDDA
ncbi:hypothetical protein P691DRAFT_659783 [Macrolepiota fuliginosa MF-IS2]|uniref:Uncharacterized protein n=1 Tax=Macrolepiota fuliginosa MF-IS2 TaxID=1400762 RepID=A0A9P6C8H0_9AGAR|nr:hypothetical protein P691DRAFT_659783 [Macrolepiota fuliginosa MF-IS2]